MFDSFSEKSPSIPLLLKGDVFLRGLFPSFKEGLGEIFDCGNRERISHDCRRCSIRR